MTPSRICSDLAIRGKRSFIRKASTVARPVARKSSTGSHRINRKMLVPLLLQRMEQRGDFSTARIDSRNFVRFVQTAVGALQGQIGQNCRAAPASRYDMINVKHCRLPDLRHMTILTLPVVALEDFIPERSGNRRQTHGTLCDWSAMEMISPNSAICTSVRSSAASVGRSEPSAFCSRSSCIRSTNSAESSRISVKSARGTEIVTGSTVCIMVDYITPPGSREPRFLARMGERS